MYDTEDRVGSTKKIMTAVFDLIERILGADSGTFTKFALKMDNSGNN